MYGGYKFDTINAGVTILTFSREISNDYNMSCRKNCSILYFSTQTYSSFRVKVNLQYENL